MNARPTFRRTDWNDRSQSPFLLLANVDDRSSDLMDMAFAILLKSSAVIRKAPLRNAKPQFLFPWVNVSSFSSGRTGACLLLKNFVRRRYGRKPADCSAS